MSVFDEAVTAQRRAAQPDRSAWVAANAGSGKTRVLTDRVARLLLRGVRPERILCLTFTKAAASEMQNRLYARLGSWAMLDERALRTELATLGEDLGTVDLAAARTLFASAIETPGGLKIQTIHSFCDRVLKQFPLEAGVPAKFDTLDERAAAMLHEEVLNEMLSDEAGTHALQALLMETRADDLSGLIGPLLNAFDNKRPSGVDQPPPVTVPHVLNQNDRSILARIGHVLPTGGATDQRAIPVLENLLSAEAPLEQLTYAASLLLTKSGNAPFSPNGFPTKAVKDASDIDLHALADLKLRVVEARDRYAEQLTERRKHILGHFADLFLARLADAKSQRGVLEFSDLISKTRSLLTQGQMAQWVLFKLDGGIDHILVDEAQDTSPDQWAIIEALTEDFMAGGDTQAERSLFVVGDEKQSIYSFQGASPTAFADMKSTFAQKLAAIDRPLFEQGLNFSFRSAGSILNLVDTVFNVNENKQFTPTEHIAVASDKPGRVVLWPYLEAEDDGKEPAWFEPVDMPTPGDPKKRLAMEIASEVARITDGSTVLATGQHARAVQPGDILILVRGRDRLFLDIISELTSRGVPVAGADRLKITENLAVRDVLSLLKFIALAEDDLSLAEVLRSPLCGLGEPDLFALAHNRPRSLWEALRTSDVHADVLGFLQDMRNRADFDRPYELIELCLSKHHGRERLLARLGPETEDALNELLAQALVFEQNTIPDLVRFIHWFESGTVEVKRDLDGTRNEVRVMTVHGAKGLEAPIVILPDTGPKKTQTQKGEIKRMPDGRLIWPAADPWKDRAHMDDLKVIKQQEEQERQRLLYVALTRAENWLIVAGAGKPLNGDANGSWYEQIDAAMTALNANLESDGRKSLSNGTWPSSSDDQSEHVTIPAKLPDFVFHRPKAAAAQPTVLNPSKVNGPKTLSGGAEKAEALETGTLLHLLLEHLPQAPETEWENLAHALIPDAAKRKHLSSKARSLFEMPSITARFSGALHEVPFVATVSEQKIEGIFDLLKVTDETIEITDFKSNQIVPKTAQEIPTGLLTQMALYMSAGQQIFPDRTVQVAILWTETGELMEIPTSLLTAALRNISDA
ncbi:MAG: UvrD-helicase domain-containing protein [Pseudomonadota bacterium]